MITAVNPGTVNPSTIKFLADLLGTNDYVDIPSKISDDQDALNLLDFIIHVSFGLNSNKTMLNLFFRSFWTLSCSMPRGYNMGTVERGALCSSSE